MSADVTATGAPAENTVMARKKAQPSFEHALNELQQLVERLESGTLPLEEALDCFEQGVRLTRDCQNALQLAEQRVRTLLEHDSPKATLTDSDA